MVQSHAKTVSEYLAELMPEGCVERMGSGMISYDIPLERYPKTYNGKPLMYAALADQKRYYSICLVGAYARSEVERQLRDDFERAGRKLDFGKCCIRLRKLDELPLDTMGRSVAATPVASYLQIYEKSRTRGS